MKPRGEWASMRRKDLGLLIVVGFLFAALTFNLGLYWGVKWGLAKAHVMMPSQGEHALPAPQVFEAANHGPEKSTEDGKDWQDEKQIPESIREGFVKSKQNALIESQLRSKDRVSVGTSIADAEEYFSQKKLKWGEAPAEVQKMDRSVASEETPAPVVAQKKSLSSALFERSPASVEEFKPVPGQLTVQVASYATQEEAVARVKVLISAGASDAYYTKNIIKGEMWYQVMVGSFKEEKWAKHQGEQLVRRRMASEYFIRKVPD